jgi:hypothetical protein
MAGGFTPLVAMQAIVTINGFVLGSVIDEQADAEEGLGWGKAGDRLEPDNFPTLSEALVALQAEGGRSAAFDAGLMMIIEGMRALRVTPSAAN